MTGPIVRDQTGGGPTRRRRLTPEEYTKLLTQGFTDEEIQEEADLPDVPARPRRRLTPEEYTKLQGAGFSDEDIKEEADLPEAPVGRKVTGLLASARAGIPFSDEIVGAGAALANLPHRLRTGEGAKVRDDYVGARNREQERLAQARKDMPVASRATEFGASLLLPAAALTTGVKGVQSLHGAAKWWGAVKPAVKTGAAYGGAYSAGASRADDPNAIQGLGEVAGDAGKGAIAGALTGVVLGTGMAAVPAIAREFGFVTQSARDRYARQAIDDALRNTGQTPARLQARADAFRAKHGRDPTLLEAMGDDEAGRAVLEDAIAALTPKAKATAGAASQAVESPILHDALQRAARREPRVKVIPEGPFGLKYKAAAVPWRLGVRRAEQKEGSRLLERLLEPHPANPPTTGATSAPMGPAPYRPQGTALPPGPQPKALPPGAYELPGLPEAPFPAIGPVMPPVRPMQAHYPQRKIWTSGEPGRAVGDPVEVPEKFFNQTGTTWTGPRPTGQPGTLEQAVADFDVKQRGAGRARLRADEERFGLPAVTPPPPQGVQPPPDEAVTEAILGQMGRQAREHGTPLRAGGRYSPGNPFGKIGGPAADRWERYNASRTRP